MAVMAGEPAGAGVVARGTLGRPALGRHHVLPAVLGLGTVALLLWGVRQLPDPTAFQQWGLLGVFLVNLVTSASIVLPLPGFAAVTAAGTVWSPLLVGIVAGVGSATGELTGYLAGRSGGALMGGGDNPHQRRLRDWLERYGFLTLFTIAALPLPLFDFAGIAAGATRYPVWRFWLACALGKAIKLAALAWAGSLLGGLLGG